MTLHHLLPFFIRSAFTTPRTISAFRRGASVWSWDGKKAQREREFYYSGREEREQLTDDEYYAKLEELAGDLTISCVVIDPSAASFITLIRKKKKFQTKKAKNDVLDGIRFTAACVKAGLITVHESCESCLREFKLYRWNEKATTDTVIKENDHAMDDTRYFALKTVSSTKAIDSALRSALKQIAEKPGGVILDCSEVEARADELQEAIEYRMQRSGQFSADVIVFRNGKATNVFRYKK